MYLRVEYVLAVESPLRDFFASHSSATLSAKRDGESGGYPVRVTAALRFVLESNDNTVPGCQSPPSQLYGIINCFWLIESFMLLASII